MKSNMHQGKSGWLFHNLHALKELALPRASHSGEIALAGSRLLRATLAAAPVLFAHEYNKN
jgi:hypothetical protein